jgi:DNA primase
MIFLTTTAIDIDEELQNRCLTLTVDESREQTERIHTLQRQARTLEGLRRKKRRQKLLRLLRNAQRLLKPVEIVNPWADQLTFANEHIHSRRDHEKYLTLIDVIAFLHQYQRPLYHLAEDAAKNQEHPPYILASLEDIALANRLSVELLGRSFGDLPPQTRRVYDTIKEIVRKQVESNATGQAAILFSRREIRDHLGWGITQIRLHLERLREMDLIALRSGRPGSRFQYELLADCRAPDPLNPIGLTDARKLQPRQHPPLSDANLSPTCRGPRNECNTMNKKWLQPTCRDAALAHAMEPCIPAGGTSYT